MNRIKQLGGSESPSDNCCSYRWIDRLNLPTLSSIQNQGNVGSDSAHWIKEPSAIAIWIHPIASSTVVGFRDELGSTWVSLDSYRLYPKPIPYVPCRERFSKKIAPKDEIDGWSRYHTYTDILNTWVYSKPTLTYNPTPLNSLEILGSFAKLEIPKLSKICFSPTKTSNFHTRNGSQPTNRCQTFDEMPSGTAVFDSRRWNRWNVHPSKWSTLFEKWKKKLVV